MEYEETRSLHARGWVKGSVRVLCHSQRHKRREKTLASLYNGVMEPRCQDPSFHDFSRRCYASLKKQQYGSTLVLAQQSKSLNQIEFFRYCFTFLVQPSNQKLSLQHGWDLREVYQTQRAPFMCSYEHAVLFLPYGSLHSKRPLPGENRFDPS